MIKMQDFILTNMVVWTGKTLIDRSGSPLKCVKNIGNFKVFAFRNKVTRERNIVVVDLSTWSTYYYAGEITPDTLPKLYMFLNTKVQRAPVRC